MVYFFRPALFAPIGLLCTVGYVTHIFLYKYIISCFFFSVNQKRRKEYLFKNIYVHGKMDCSSFCFLLFFESAIRIRLQYQFVIKVVWTGGTAHIDGQMKKPLCNLFCLLHPFGQSWLIWGKASGTVCGARCDRFYMIF